MRFIKRNTLYNLCLLSASIIFTLAMLELFLRFFSPPCVFSSMLPLRPHNRMEIHISAKGLAPVAMNTTNKWGLRGAEPPADWDRHYTIVTVGGSTTQCFYLDDSKTWPALLEAKLRAKDPNVWVGNGGIDGHTTRGHILFMKEVIAKIKPKAVILLVGVNDLGLSLSEEKRVNGSQADTNKPSWAVRYFGWSRLFQILYTWKQVLFDKATMVNRVSASDFALKPLMEQLPPLPADLSAMLPQLEEYRSNIKEIIRLGRESNVRLIFMTQPLVADDTEHWQGVEGAFYWVKRTNFKLSAASYWRLLDVYNQTLKEVCTEEQVECFDLASAVPHSEDYFYDIGHFNERGAELVADKVAGFLGDLPSGSDHMKSEKGK